MKERPEDSETIDPQRIAEHLGGLVALGSELVYRDLTTNEVLGKEQVYYVTLKTKDDKKKVQIELIPGLKDVEVEVRGFQTRETLDVRWEQRPLLNSILLHGVDKVRYLVTELGGESHRVYSVCFISKTLEMKSIMTIKSTGEVSSWTYKLEKRKYPLNSTLEI